MKLVTHAVTLISVDADLASLQLGDLARFYAHLGVKPAIAWPPAGFETGDLVQSLAKLKAEPELEGWLDWFVVAPEEVARSGRLVGLAGFSGRPGAAGAVWLRLGLVEPGQDGAAAVGALKALASWALCDPLVERLFADAEPGPIADAFQAAGFTELGEVKGGRLRFEKGR